MSCFDYVACDYPPIRDKYGWVLQSKDTEACYLDQYLIKSDGTFWHQTYDARVVDDPAAPLGMWIDRLNKRWEQVTDQESPMRIYNKRCEIDVYFTDGVVSRFEVVEEKK